eukprot:7722185-Karenia_brevis.AAC.1
MSSDVGLAETQASYVEAGSFAVPPQAGLVDPTTILVSDKARIFSDFKSKVLDEIFTEDFVPRPCHM